VSYEVLVFIEQENLRFEVRLNGEARSQHYIDVVQWIFTADEQMTDFEDNRRTNATV
jgi:hypothetical protein